ncbi:LysM peptidoglycan-binding domain-containing protein [Heyndrickxia acidicola]|uniref:LysM domain-containing protein n=1 Tax=Heyndrickxia acidicola TaxID=209389 RepID=A0ABU6MNC2_9BACI|nr:LysM domain-containing protein [Heyndrickxia acidicola]MED1205123.1 LysM domain-containing protein [Heyndrickxia acidicola]
MKKLIGLIAVLIVLYSVYFDLKFGTIPNATVASAANKPDVNQTQPKPASQKSNFKIIEVKPGDTVLSIAAKLEKNNSKIEVAKVIKDFTKLNPGIQPKDIQIGQIYRFPIYQQH